MSQDEIKAALKQKEFRDAVEAGLNKWLDRKFAAFGRWTAAGMAAAGLFALVYFILQMQGWRHS